MFRVGIFLGFVGLTTRTMHPHGAYVRGAKRNRIDPHRGGSERPTACTGVALLCAFAKGVGPALDPLVVERGLEVVACKGAVNKQ